MGTFPCLLLKQTLKQVACSLWFLSSNFSELRSINDNILPHYACSLITNNNCKRLELRLLKTQEREQIQVFYSSPGITGTSRRQEVPLCLSHSSWKNPLLSIFWCLPEGCHSGAPQFWWRPGGSFHKCPIPSFLFVCGCNTEQDWEVLGGRRNSDLASISHTLEEHLVGGRLLQRLYRKRLRTGKKNPSSSLSSVPFQFTWN